MNERRKEGRDRALPRPPARPHEALADSPCIHLSVMLVTVAPRLSGRRSLGSHQQNRGNKSCLTMKRELTIVLGKQQWFILVLTVLTY